MFSLMMHSTKIDREIDIQIYTLAHVYTYIININQNIEETCVIIISRC